MTQAFKIGFLLFPHVTQLDFTGPAQILSMMSGAEIHVVWKTLDPVPSDCNITIVPTHTFETCPDLDMVCVPGGPGQASIMGDGEVLQWLARQGKQASYVTSVCSGSLLLGAAGLMKGYRAGCHWAFRDLLPNFGAIPVNERVVVDRNRISGGGVTAGIDFALIVAHEVRGSDEAQRLQLLFEYAPAPPFDTGVPEKAPAAMAVEARRILEEAVRKFSAIPDQA